MTTHSEMRAQLAKTALETIPVGGLMDFWATYDEALGAIRGDLEREFGQVLRVLAGLELPRKRPSAHLLAMRGRAETDWEPYVQSLLDLGSSLARECVSLETWLSFMAAFQKRHLALLVRSLPPDPQRLGPALEALATFYQVGAVAVGGQLQETTRHLEVGTTVKTFFESSLDAMLLGSQDGEISWANPAACRMFGRSEEELRRSGRAGIMEQTDPRRAEAQASIGRTGGFAGELNAIRASGEVFPVEVSVREFPDVEGRLRRAIVMRDVSDRVARDLALQQSEQRYRHLVETAQEAIVLVDVEGTVKFANPAMADLVGLPLPYLAGTSFLDFVPAEAREVLEPYLAPGRDDDSLELETEIRHRRGEERWAALKVRPVAESDPDEPGRLITLLDFLGAVLEKPRLGKPHAGMPFTLCIRLTCCFGSRPGGRRSARLFTGSLRRHPASACHGPCRLALSVFEGVGERL